MLTFAASGENLGTVKLNRQIRQVILGVVQLAKVVSSLEETLEDREAGLRVSLSPFLALGIPHLNGTKTLLGHAEIRRVENITGFIIHILAAITKAKNLEDLKVAREIHGDELSTAFLVGRGNGAENGAPGLTRLVPGRDGLLGHGADRRVGLVKVEDAGGGLLEELAAAVS